MGKRQSAADGVHAGLLVQRPRFGVPRGGSKFGAKRAVADGRSFASKAERDRYLELKLLERAGAITGLICQPAFKFVVNGLPLMIGNRQARYTADFQYVEADTGQTVVEDVKGMMTPDARLRIALMIPCFGIVVRLVKRR